MTDVRSDSTESETPETGVMASPFSRRGFLVGAVGAAGAAVVLGACAGNGDDSDLDTGAGSGTDDTAATGGGDASGDLATAKFAAGLEVLAVGTYKAALDAATAGKLGPVPPAGAEFVKTAMAQHQEHLDLWNSVIEGAGEEPVSTPDAKLKPVVDQKFGQVKDFGGAAMLALELEQIAAATYLGAIPALSDKSAVTAAGQMHITDMQHSAVLLFVLGEYPVPDVFAKTDKAATA